MNDYLGRKVNWTKTWQHFNRMQKRVMADKTTKKDFFSQPEQERWDSYQWLQNQCGEYSCWM